jgi:hypothetical protein
LGPHTSDVCSAKIDKDPTWRSGAVFTREEVEQLISDGRIPEERRHSARRG